MRYFLKCFAILALCLTATGLSAQSVQQSGQVTVGQTARWIGNGIIGTGGTAADGLLTALGITNANLSSFCISSARASAAGRNQLCFGTQTNSASVISVQNYGTATAQPLQFNINGTTVVPAGISGSPATNSMMCYDGANGLITCGLLAVSGTITSGVWGGTAIAVDAGGTGATNAAGARTNLGLGTVAVQAASAVAITGGTITGMANPSTATDVANKQYVDGIAAGINILTPSRLATAAVLPNTPSYANGASGVGATLTAGSNAALTVDGTSVSVADRILVKNQASALQNGVYAVTTVGDGSNPWVITRSTDFDTAAEMLAGSYTLITAGATNINAAFVLQTTVAVVGTNAVNFVQYSAPSGVASLGSATGAIGLGTGLAISGGNLVSSALSNVRLAKTANYTLANSDKTKTVVLGGATQFTLTVGAASGFDSDFAVNVINQDTTASKILAVNGYSNFTLDPGATVTLTNQNSAWFIINKPIRSFSLSMFIDPAGSDSNGCLTALAPCLTPQRVIDLCPTGWICSVTMAAGTYNAENTILSYYKGVSFSGDCGSPTGVNWRVTSNGTYAILVQDHAILGMSCMQITSGATGNTGIYVRQFAIADYVDISWGAFAAGTHVFVIQGSANCAGANNQILGGAAFHVHAGNNSTVNYSCTETIPSATSWTTFARAFYSSVIDVTGSTFSGAGATTSTGAQCNADGVSVIAKGAVVFPGTAATCTATNVSSII